MLRQYFKGFFFVAFVIGPQKWPIYQFLAIGTVNYIYKFGVAVLLTPVIYFAHYWIDLFLGEELAEKLKSKAAEEEAQEN